MLDMPKPSKNMKKKLRNRPVERKQVGGSGRNLAREDAKRRNDIRTGTQRKPKRQSAASEIDMNE
jgi:ATP-dependent RNA helicase DDX52/ROK1